jgi:aspartate 1-decarboxylase
MLRSKLHRVTVTQADLHYEGSCGIDANLLEAADIWVNEKIELYNVNNGERFATYAIEGLRGSGCIQLNICTYAPMTEEQAKAYTPKVVFVDGDNKITGMKK